MKNSPVLWQRSSLRLRKPVGDVSSIHCRISPRVKYAKDIANELRAAQVRVSAGFGNTPIKAKIQDAEHLRVHTMLVIGGRDLDAGAVSVRFHGKGPQGAKPKGEVIANILASTKERRA